jgi:SNF2 family DNA or RNA helicase
MNNICFYYYLTISPDDINSGKIKKELNLNQLKSHPNILKNEDVFKKINFYLPNINYKKMNRYYINFEKNGYKIDLVFVEIINSILITSQELTQINMINYIDRHIKYKNNLTNSNWFDYNLSLMIDSLENNRIYNINSISIELKTELFAYQLDNIHWMHEIEENPIKGKITEDRIITFPDGRVYNYTHNKIVYDIPELEFKGAIIADEMGIGKTLQILCHCARTPETKTLIVVPEHLTSHWQNEIKKHFYNSLENLLIVSFEQFDIGEYNGYSRIIVDEIHEIYSIKKYEKVFNKLVLYSAKYKWGVSGTPFATNHALFSIIKFLTGINFHNYLIERMDDYLMIYCKLFRKNTIANAQKYINLPEMNVENKLLTFLENEMQIYLAETNAKENANIQFLRKLCCNIIKQFSDENNSITEQQLMNTVLASFHSKWQKEVEIENSIVQNIQEAKKKFAENKNPELQTNIQHFQYLLQNQKIITNNRKSAYNFLYQQIENKQKNCPICTNDINKINGYLLTKCSHIVCENCGKQWLKKNPICPICRQSCPLKDASIIKNHIQRQQYSTKIVELLELMKLDGQFLIYTQYDFMIEEIGKFLGKECVAFSVLNSNNDILEFKNENRKAIIISSQKNASGLDLSFVKNVIIFEPIIGNYNFLRDTEKQIIGRVFRINQKENVNVFRLIIRNTIEEEIYKNIIYNLGINTLQIL